MATMQVDKEQVRSDSNGDRQRCPSYAEDNIEDGRTGGRTPDGRFRKSNRAAAGHGPPSGHAQTPNDTAFILALAAGAWNAQAAKAAGGGRGGGGTGST